jgi:RsiW-degrading membrane proteinase PrsW (M82 family)
MALYFALGFCALLAAALVYRYDLYEREPWYMIVLAIVLGAAGMRIVGAIELVSLVLVDSYVAVAALAALHEEAARIVLVLGIALVFPRQFNDPMDGIVYGSMVGLGMALEESFYLLGLVAAPDVLLLPVELVRLLGHLVMAGIAGFGIGLARARVPGWPSQLIRCVAIAFLLHFLWDWIALASDTTSLTSLQTMASIGLMLFGIVFYGSLVVVGSRLSKHVFAPMSETQLWGWPFTVFLSTNTARSVEDDRQPNE